MRHSLPRRIAADFRRTFLVFWRSRAASGLVANVLLGGPSHCPRSSRVLEPNGDGPFSRSLRSQRRSYIPKNELPLYWAGFRRDRRAVCPSYDLEWPSPLERPDRSKSSFCIQLHLANQALDMPYTSLSGPCETRTSHQIGRIVCYGGSGKVVRYYSTMEANEK